MPWPAKCLTPKGVGYMNLLARVRVSSRKFFGDYFQQVTGNSAAGM